MKAFVRATGVFVENKQTKLAAYNEFLTSKEARLLVINKPIPPLPDIGKKSHFH